MYDKIKKVYHRHHTTNPVATSFFTSFIILAIIFLILGIFSCGNSIQYMLFHNRQDYFMDFFNSAYYSKDSPYTFWHVIYPPLITIFYGIIGRYLGSMYSGSVEYRDSPEGLIIYAIITTIVLLVIEVTTIYLLKNKSTLIKIATAICILLSYPVLFAIDRGNSIIISIAFVLIFLCLYNSENKLLRCASYISLGCAAGIKIYPAFFAIILLREKRILDFAICAVIVIALLLVPFIWTDGNLAILMDTILSYSSETSKQRGAINIAGYVDYISLSDSLKTTLSMALSIAAYLISLLTVIFNKNLKTWEVYAIISSTIIIGPGVSAEYLFLYLVPPLVAFLQSETKYSYINCIGIITFVMVMSLMPGSEEYYYILPTIKGIFVFVLYFTLIGHGLKGMKQKSTSQASK